MIKTIKPSPFLAHVFSTAGASLATAVSSIFVLRFLAQGLGSESFGLYSLSNRAFSILIPFASLMMGLAMSRNLSSTPDREEKNAYILSASSWVLLSVGFVWITGVLFRERLSSFFLGSSQRHLLWFATLSSVTFFSFYSLLDGIYFGTSKIFKANLWQWLLSVIGPLAIAFRFRHAPVYRIIFLLSALYSLALIPLALTWFGIWKTKTIKGDLLRHKGRLIAFSAPRIAGGWLASLLLLIGPLFASHFISYAEAGFLMLAQSVFRVAEMGTNAFASVALSKAGSLIGEGKQVFLKERVGDMIEMIFQIGLFLAAHLFLWSDDLVILWLGNEYLNVSLRIKIYLLGFIPYFAYVVLRPIIEALEFKPVNVFHLGISCAAALSLAFPLARAGGALGLALSTSLGFLVLGALTVRYFGKKNLAGRAIFKIVMINAALAVPLIVIQPWLRLWPGSLRFTASITLELLLAALYVYVLWSLKSRWILEFQKRLITYDSSEESAHD